MLPAKADNAQAHDEMLALATTLKKLGVNSDVIEHIQHDAARSRPRKRRRSAAHPDGVESDTPWERGVSPALGEQQDGGIHDRAETRRSQVLLLDD